MKEKNKIYFASDLHLGSDCFEDPIITEKRFVGWLDYIKEDAQRLYLLGDIFDFWFEYKHVVSKGFSRFLGKIAEMTDAGIEVHFFIGNHDIWMYDYLPKEIGVIIHREALIVEICGKKCYLAHGDGMGDNSKKLHLMRKIFHNSWCRKMFASIHPRWGMGFGQAWSLHNRKKGTKVPVPYLGEDKEHLVCYAKQYLQQDPSIDFFVFGHRHIPLDLMLSKKSRVIILGDWLQLFSYALMDEHGLRLLDYHPTTKA